MFAENPAIEREREGEKKRPLQKFADISYRVSMTFLFFWQNCQDSIGANQVTAPRSQRCTSKYLPAMECECEVVEVTQSCRTHCRQEACISVVMVLPLVVSCADLGQVHVLYKILRAQNESAPENVVRDSWNNGGSGTLQNVGMFSHCFCPSTSSKNMVFSNPSWIGPCELSVGIRLQQVCDGLKVGPNRPSKSWNHISLQATAGASNWPSSEQLVLVESKTVERNSSTLA